MKPRKRPATAFHWEADAATADMAATASHTSGSASELGETARHLERLVEQFKV
jgi:methyl-accepting chemotaxis protein